MSTNVTIPEFSESVSEGTVGAWLKKVGDPVTEGETLVEIETDKVVLEIPAPGTGVLKEIIKDQNEIVTSSEVIAVLETNNASGSQKLEESPENKTPATINSISSQPEKVESYDKPNPVKTSPAVRKLMHEQGVKVEEVQPSGKGNRVTKEDVTDQSQTSNTQIAPTSSSAVEQSLADERVAMSSLRRRIAERLVTVQQDYAMLTTFNEVNMQQVLKIRERHKEQFVERYGIKLGFMSFFVLAAVEALNKYPIINASVDGKDIVYHRYMDIGIAVSSKRGLVVPIIRNAESKSLSSIEVEINELAVKARENKLTMDDLSGGTFTITNGGVFGSMLSTPIINPPQSAILGMHAIEKRPVVKNDEIVIMPMMYLALTYDHRIIDGRDAVSFLSHIKKIVEDPIKLLLHV